MRQLDSRQTTVNVLHQALRQVEMCADTYSTTADVVLNRDLAGLLREQAEQWALVGNCLRARIEPDDSLATACPWGSLLRARVCLLASLDDFTTLVHECSWIEALARGYCARAASRAGSLELSRTLSSIMPSPLSSVEVCT